MFKSIISLIKKLNGLDLFPNERLVGDKPTYIYDCRDFEEPRKFKR